MPDFIQYLLAVGALFGLLYYAAMWGRTQAVNEIDRREAQRQENQVTEKGTSWTR